MYQMNYPNNYGMNNNYRGYGNNRIAGGFVFPFLLGGVTGAAIAPAFWRPNYYPYPRPYMPYPYYGPYYR